MKKYKVICISALASVLLFGCGGEPEGMWEATVTSSQNGKEEAVGQYMSRDECQHAGLMHIAGDKEQAHKRMERNKMAVSCSFVPAS